MQRHVVLGHGEAEPVLVRGTGKHVLDIADGNIRRGQPGVVALVGIVAALAHADAQRGALVVHRLASIVSIIVSIDLRKVIRPLCRRGTDAHQILSLLVTADRIDVADVDPRALDRQRAVRCVDLIEKLIRIVRVQVQKAQRVERFSLPVRNRLEREPVLIAEAADHERLVRAKGQARRRLPRVVRLVLIAVQDLHGQRARQAERVEDDVAISIIMVQGDIMLARRRGVEIERPVRVDLRIRRAGGISVLQVPRRVKVQRELLAPIGIVVARDRQGNVLPRRGRGDLEVVNVPSCKGEFRALAAVQGRRRRLRVVRFVRVVVIEGHGEGVGCAHPAGGKVKIICPRLGGAEHIPRRVSDALQSFARGIAPPYVDPCVGSLLVHHNILIGLCRGDRKVVFVFRKQHAVHRLARLDRRGRLERVVRLVRVVVVERHGEGHRRRLRYPHREIVFPVRIRHFIELVSVAAVAPISPIRAVESQARTAASLVQFNRNLLARLHVRDRVVVLPGVQRARHRHADRNVLRALDGRAARRRCCRFLRLRGRSERAKPQQQTQRQYRCKESSVLLFH